MTDPFGLDRERVLVSGAGGILGSSLCAALIEAGASVVALDNDKASLDALRSAHPDGLLEAAVVDVGVENAVVDAVERAWQRGRITGLVNNAASKSHSLDGFFAPFESSTLETWREVNATNLDGSYLLAREVGRRMATSGGGTIVQIASIYGVVGPDQRVYEGSRYLDRQISSPAVYSASKAGVLGLMRFLATLWGESGVRVNAVTPGGIASGQNEEFDKKYSARVPLGRMAEPADIVHPIRVLLSPASAYVTGHNLIVDGGLTAW